MTKTHRPWSLLSNHGIVLMVLSRHGDLTVTGIAELTGLSKPTVMRVLRDLREARMLLARRRGRRNVYEIDGTVRLRHPVLKDKRVQALISAFPPP